MSPNCPSSNNDGGPIDTPLVCNGDSSTWLNWIGIDGTTDNLFSDELCSSNVDDDAELLPVPQTHDYMKMHSLLIDSLLKDKEAASAHDYESQIDPVQRKRSKARSFRGVKRNRSSGEGVVIGTPEGTDIGGIQPCLSSVSSISDATSVTYMAPKPTSLLSDNCRLQKDKGPGVRPGSAVQVIGKDAVLDKLRVKTEILRKAAGSSFADDDASNTSNFSSKTKWLSSSIQTGGVITKGEPRITSSNPPETRSILGFKMGFLSIKYGILLQWGLNDGLVHLIVMRKNVSDDFLNQAKSITQVTRIKTKPPINSLIRPRGTLSNYDRKRGGYEAMENGMTKLDVGTEELATQTDDLSPRCVQGAQFKVDMNSCTAMVSKAVHNSTEVSLLGPPYLVPRPINFPKSFIEIRVNQLENFRDKKPIRSKKLFLKLSLCKGADGPSEEFQKSTDDNTYTIRFDDKDFDSLRIGVYRRIKLQKDRLLGTSEYPLDDIEAHHDGPSEVCGCRNAISNLGSRHPLPMLITIPCKMLHDPNGSSGSIVLSVVFISPYRWWLERESCARRQQSEVKMKKASDVNQNISMQKSDIDYFDEIDEFYRQQDLQENCLFTSLKKMNPSCTECLPFLSDDLYNILFCC